MQSPSAEWALALSYLAAIDYLRHRGEADFDTLSECVRQAFDRHPRGRLLWALSLGTGAAVLWRHIDKDMTRRPDRRASWR